MRTQDFFDEARESSLVKSTIISKYFSTWAQIMVRNLQKYGGKKIAYVDLFCGPGRYEDGTESTPLRILKMAANDQHLRRHLVTWFVDKDAGFVEDLAREIRKIPEIDSMTFPPVVTNAEVDAAITQFFEQKKLVPTLLLLDPWGYKGVTLRLIRSVIKDWGCDCIIFFNYNRINAGLENARVRGHMNELFGEDRVKELDETLTGMNPEDREFAIVNEFSVALKQVGGEFVLPFCFKDKNDKRTSHYLVFSSKHPLGYTKMKEIMANCSSDEKQGVPTFQYAPAGPKQGMLFELNRPLDDLGPMLLNDFAGQKLKMKDIFDHHHVGKPYIEKNYKQVLNRLESEDKIRVDPPMDKRKKRGGIPTFGDEVLVAFPKRG